MLRWIYKLIFFNLLSWKIVGKPPDIPKYVLVVAPHTSNWDFMIGVFSRRILAFNPRYAGKKELFVFPFGYFFRWMGGYPVDRSGHHHFVDAMVDIFNKEKEFILTLTPEGTRDHAPKWKSGFFHIARKANVPIVKVAFDYGRRQVVISEPEYASGEASDCIARYKSYFSGFQGKYPEKGVKWPE